MFSLIKFLYYERGWLVPVATVPKTDPTLI